MPLKLAYHANCWGPLGGNDVGVTPISQLTYRTFGDMEQAIRDLGAAGYTGTELFDGNLLDYEGRHGDLRAVLNQSGVALVAGYSGANFIFDDILGEELARIERAAPKRRPGSFASAHATASAIGRGTPGSSRGGISRTTRTATSMPGANARCPVIIS